MNAFPSFTNIQKSDLFENIVGLYDGDKIKILEAAQRATLTNLNRFVMNSGSIDPQLETLRLRLKRTSDNEGQELLIKIIEELFEDLSQNGANGVSVDNFLRCAKIEYDSGIISFNNFKIWNWKWEILIDENSQSISFGIRNANASPGKIVPEYILHYVRAALNAFRNRVYASSLALMTIALEGTLRDALHHKGYTYVYGAPTSDVYEILEMNVHKHPSGFLVSFPSAMPNEHSLFLSSPGDPVSQTVRIKRVIKNNRPVLEIRDCSPIVDFWSSDNIVTPGSIRIGGLGAAIDIGRNTLNIITPEILPEDLDTPIKAIRNNLIHLSENALTEIVAHDGNGDSMTLATFLKNKNRVFDTICTIGDTIDKVYTKIANGTL